MARIGSGSNKYLQLTDGTDFASILDLTNNDALAVAIVDGSGNQITSFGGGTQYTEGDTDTTITGTAMMWEDTSDTLRAVSAAKPLPVGDAGSSLTVDSASGPLEVRLRDGDGTFLADVAGNFTDGTTIPISLSTVAFNGMYNGSNWDRVRGDATNGMLVNLGANNDVSLNAGTNAIGGITGAGSNTQIKDDSFYAEDVTSGLLTVHSRLWDGTAYDRQPGNSTDGMLVNLGANNDVSLNAGTNNIGDVDVFSNTAKDGSGTRYQPLVDTDGHLQVDVLSGGGGGTQYTEGDTDATVTGTAVMWEDTSDTLRVASAAKPLPVNIISGAGSGGTAIQDDTAFTVGTTNLTPAGGTYKSTRDAVDDNDAGAFAMTAKRGLYVSLETPNADSAMDDTLDAMKAVTVNRTVSDTITGAADAVTIDADGVSSIGIQITGTWTATLQFECTVDDTNWFSVQPWDISSFGTDTSTNDNGNFIVNVAGYSQFRVRASAYTSGTATVTLQGHFGSQVAHFGRTTIIDHNGSNVVGGSGTSDGTATSNTGLYTNARHMFFNGSTWDRSRGDTTNGLDVDVTRIIPGTGATNLGKAIDTALGATDTGVLAMGARDDTLGTLTEADGDVTVIRTNSRGAMWVKHDGNIDVNSHEVTNAGTFAVQESGSALTALQLIDDAVYVDDADWTADTSKHMLSGAVTQVATTANTDGDTTPLTTNAMRELRVATNESDLATAGTSHVKKYYTNAGSVTDGIIWSPAAGKRWYLTHLSINVSAASTVTIEDDPVAGDVVVYKAEFAANSGVVLTFPDTPMFSGEDAADLLVTSTAGNVYVTAVGYEI